MYLTEEAAKGINFNGFDILVILFTLLIAWGFARSLTAKERNLFAIGFAGISLVVFLFIDAVMLMNWFGMLGEG